MRLPRVRASSRKSAARIVPSGPSRSITNFRVPRDAIFPVARRMKSATTCRSRKYSADAKP
jgi:hypothetical protein